MFAYSFSLPPPFSSSFFLSFLGDPALDSLFFELSNPLWLAFILAHSVNIVAASGGL
jgi:hypothetical protein